MQQTHFYSNGKLLLSGEYLVLHGAKALALPLKLGQDLIVEQHSDSESDLIHWKGYEDNMLWFEAQISRTNLSIQKSSDLLIASKLADILKKTKKLNPSFLTSKQKFSIQTNLEFKREWGFGSSATLINNIAKWAEVDPYQLLNLSFGGSGYDIACADAEQPIFYTNTDEGCIVEDANFQPNFKKHLFFVYLGRKQNSSESIRQFNKLRPISAKLVQEISALSKQMTNAKTLEEFNYVIRGHEEIMSSLMKTPSVKNHNFPDFEGEVKSLGAWGGDFILATSQHNLSEVKEYFSERKLEVVFNYDDIVKI